MTPTVWIVGKIFTVGVLCGFWGRRKRRIRCGAVFFVFNAVRIGFGFLVGGGGGFCAPLATCAIASSRVRGYVLEDKRAGEGHARHDENALRRRRPSHNWSNANKTECNVRLWSSRL